MYDICVRSGEFEIPGKQRHEIYIVRVYCYKLRFVIIK